MTAQSRPSVVKIALGVAAGIILAAFAIVFGLTGVGAVAARDDAKLAELESEAYHDCRAAIIRAAKSMDEIANKVSACDHMRDAYRVKWGREP